MDQYSSADCAEECDAQERDQVDGAADVTEAGIGHPLHEQHGRDCTAWH